MGVIKLDVFLGMIFNTAVDDDVTLNEISQHAVHNKDYITGKKQSSIEQYSVMFNHCFDKAFQLHFLGGLERFTFTCPTT